MLALETHSFVCQTNEYERWLDKQEPAAIFRILDQPVVLVWATVMNLLKELTAGQDSIVFYLPDRNSEFQEIHQPNWKKK